MPIILTQQCNGDNNCEKYYDTTSGNKLYLFFLFLVWFLSVSEIFLEMIYLNSRAVSPIFFSRVVFNVFLSPGWLFISFYFPGCILISSLFPGFFFSIFLFFLGWFYYIFFFCRMVYLSYLFLLQDGFHIFFFCRMIFLSYLFLF